MCNKYLKILNKSESGYASFVITLVMIIVVGLIVIAFASDSRLEQKNSLANVEATQAYYAAESGIHDAVAAVSNDIAKGATPLNSDGQSCDNLYSYYTTSNSNQLNGTNVQYTCLIVNPTPATLEYKNVEPGQSYVIPLQPVVGQGNISTITITWQESGYASSLDFLGCPSPNGLNSASTPTGDFPTYSSYSKTACTAGVLQLDILSNSNLTDELKSSNPQYSDANSVYLEPEWQTAGVTGTNALTLTTNSGAPSNTLENVPCVLSNPNGYACSMTITVNSDSLFYILLQSFYESNDVSISSSNGSGQLSLTGAQVEVDSTGEANGQLKRLQAFVCDSDYCNSSTAASLSPASAIESTQCVNKQFTVYPNDPTDQPTSSC